MNPDFRLIDRVDRFIRLIRSFGGRANLRPQISVGYK